MGNIKIGDRLKHEIDLKKYNIRTDLALEAIGVNKKNLKVEKIKDITVTTVKIDKEMGMEINKKEGLYITIEFVDITDFSNQKEVIKIFSNQLKKVLPKLKSDDLVLIVGLGNEKSTPDSLGPLVINQIIVTNHIYMLNELEQGFQRVSTLEPGVFGTTGLETSDIILGVVEKIQPSLLIIVDALASQSVSRINKTIQMTDTGIQPGSGIGNYRKEISETIMRIPVLAIGVPTVVDAVTIVSDTFNYMHKHYSYIKDNINNPINKLIPVTKLNYLKHPTLLKEQDKEQLLGMVGKLNDEEVKQLIYEVLSPIGYNLMVTPKEVDFVMLKLSEVIASGLNEALHKNVN